MAAIPLCCCYLFSCSLLFRPGDPYLFLFIVETHTSLTASSLGGESLVFHNQKRDFVFSPSVSVSVTNSSNESGMYRFYSGYCQGAAGASCSPRNEDPRGLPRAAEQNLTSQGLSHHSGQKQGRQDSPSPGHQVPPRYRGGMGCGPMGGSSSAGPMAGQDRAVAGLETSLVVSLLGRGLTVPGVLGSRQTEKSPGGLAGTVRAGGALRAWQLLWMASKELGRLQQLICMWLEYSI